MHTVYSASMNSPLSVSVILEESKQRILDEQQDIIRGDTTMEDTAKRIIQDLRGDLTELKDLDKVPVEIQRDSACIRNMSNWSKIKSSHKFDSPDFSAKKVRADMKDYAPKMVELLKNIRKLDEQDMRKHGRKFKHFVFSDIKTNYGAKIIASALIADGYNLGMDIPDHLRNVTRKKSITTTTVVNPKAALPRRLSPNHVHGEFSESESDSDDSSSSSDDDDDDSSDSDSDSDDEMNGGAPKKAAISLKSDEDLLKTKYNNFLLMSSVSVFGSALRVETKKAILRKFNQRPDNVYGELARIIVMDGGFKEGIDLFDIKYIHIYEPQETAADQKQVIGRGTRTCGQKGLRFHPQLGWPLHIFKYDIVFGDNLKSEFEMTDTAFEYYLRSKNIDVRLINLTDEMEQAVIEGSVDYDLNRAVHSFAVDADDSPLRGGGRASKGGAPGTHHAMRKYVHEHFQEYMWAPVKMENLCGYEGPNSMKGGASKIKFSPTQDFIRHYFVPECGVKGMLLYQSVGTGKTCTAIATATSTFVPAGYTVLWVTRTTLKNDIWKNMFDQVCNMQIRDELDRGLDIPDVNAKRMRLLSKAWSIRPMSYKQFSNLVSRKNKLYEQLVKRNGEVDPLHKTLLIIDEAHKLFGQSDLSSIERPDTDALRAALMNSYAVSGAESVRLLLMTATPITSSPMELVKLVNLCKEPYQQLPSEIDSFAAAYLDEAGRFTKEGREYFLDHIAGHISYLNRENDARQFARPIIHNVNVPLIKTEQELRKLKMVDKQLATREIDMELAEAATVVNNIKNRTKRKLKLKDFKRYLEDCAFVGRAKTVSECRATIRPIIQKIIDKQTEINDAGGSLKDIRARINDIKNTRRAVLGQMREYPETNPREFKRLTRSTYRRLKRKCTSRVYLSTAKQDELINSHPMSRMVQAGLDTIQQEKARIGELMPLISGAQKNRIQQLRELMKNPDFTSDERNVIKRVLADNMKTFKGVRNNTTKRVKGHLGELAKIEGAYTKKKRAVRKTIRKMLKKHIQTLRREDIERRKLERAEKKANKVNEVAKDALEDISDLNEELQEFVKEKTGLMKDEIKRFSEEDDNEDERKEAEKERKAAEKAAEKERKAAALESERQRKAAEKEAEKERKAAALEAERQRKAVAAEAEKKRKAAEKEAERQRKAAEKKNAKK